MDLKKILDEHAKWLAGNGGERADLQGADLLWADLQGADLQGADLRKTDLQGADLRWADLRRANDAPLAVQVGPWLVLIHSGYMRIGCERHAVDDWRQFDDAAIQSMDSHALTFWSLNRDWLLAACEAQMATIKED